MLVRESAQPHGQESLESTEADMAGLQWAKPTTVVDVAFVEWTADGHLRHSRFITLRDDKRAQDVKRE